MAALSQTPRLSSRSTASPTPRPTSSASSPGDRFPTPSNGVPSIVADHIAGGDEYDSASTSRSSSPRISRTIVAGGVTYDIVRPEELDYEVPVFGERRRKTGTTKPKKKNKRKYEEEDEAEWEMKRRRLIQEKVLRKEFVGYKEEDMVFTEDGLRLPEMPAWLNITRECQDDGSLGIFIARPSKEDIEKRWPEIIQAMEPIGVEIGAVKVALPNEYLDSPLSIEELSHHMRRSTSPIPNPHHLPIGSVPSTPIPPSALANGLNVSNSPSPRPNEHAHLIPSAQLDRDGIPKIWVVDQRLPLHTKSVSNLAPIYCVSSTNKRQISGSQLLTDITISKLHPPGVVYAPLTESNMLSRGRTWACISNGDKGGVSVYSSDNDADPYTRAYIGVGDPHLTSLPGNVMFDSKTKIVGIHTPFFYFGRAHTLFALHAEDYNAMSLNYHHFGADKIWRVVSPHCYHIVEDFVASHLCKTKKGRKQNGKKCSQFVRHASIYLPGPTLEIAGAKSIQFRQRPGELVITWPLAYHEGYNEGLNINEACGYGHKNWRRVFATGEEEKGEEAVYRPCGERCMGGLDPIILDFDPEARESKDEEEDEENEGWKDDVVSCEYPGTIGEAVPVAKMLSASRDESRKRSRPTEEEGEDSIENERDQLSSKKAKITPIPERAKNIMEAGEGMSENGARKSKVQVEMTDGVEKNGGYHPENELVETEEIPKTIDETKTVDGECDEQNGAGMTEDDESEVEGVDLVPVQPDVEGGF